MAGSANASVRPAIALELFEVKNGKNKSSLVAAVSAKRRRRDDATRVCVEVTDAGRRRFLDPRRNG